MMGERRRKGEGGRKEIERDDDANVRGRECAREEDYHVHFLCPPRLTLLPMMIFPTTRQTSRTSTNR